MENEIIKYLISIGGPTVILVFLGVYIISKWKDIKDFLIDIWLIISSVIKKGQRYGISSKIESICEKTIHDLNDLVPELGLPEISVKWIKPNDDERVIPPQVEEGKAIVLLKYNKDFTQNIVNTTAAYIQSRLLPESREYMSKGVRQAIDFTIIREFLKHVTNHHSALTYFVRQNKEESRKNQQNIMKVTSIKEAGMLSRILLREYQMWGSSICGNPIEEKYEIESKQFLDYLYNISSREYDDYTQLQFVSENIKVGILLVAKMETYAEAGTEPYVRRIREGFSKGIRTFYLLARNEKIRILQNVFSELIGTGNYNLLNGPKVFKDSQNRDNICYCIEVDSEGDMAADYALANKCIENGDVLEAVISSVYNTEILCHFNSLDVVVPIENISPNPDIRLHHYYKTGSSVFFKPLAINGDGTILGSFINTESDPKRLVDSHYSVGSEVSAIIEKIEQGYIILRVKDTNISCISYRKHLTYSKLISLTDLFVIGEERVFRIKEINYVHFSFILVLADLYDPWQRLPYHKSQDVDFSIMRIDPTCFVTELSEGITAILPYSELTWFGSLIDLERKKYHVGHNVHARIKAINERSKVIILTLREKRSPYHSYLKSMDSTKIIPIVLKGTNSHGLLGLHDDKYSVFIPFGETRIGNNYFNYSIGKKYRVYIKEIGEKGTAFIGSFKPFIEHPLAALEKYFQEGDIVKNCRIVKRTYKFYLVDISPTKDLSFTGILPISEIVNTGRISSMIDCLSSLNSLPLIIKTIDLESNSICLSLSMYTHKNHDVVENLSFSDVKQAIIIARYYNCYTIILPELWIEGILESNNVYKDGEIVNVRLTGRPEHTSFFTDEV